MNFADKREMVKKAWDKFFVLKEDEISGVDDLIKESWIRCRKNNIDFTNQDIHKGDVELREEAIRKNHMLIDIARPYINELYEIIDKSNFSITLLDAYGIVLDALSNPTVESSTEFKNIDLNENRIGTNAMGTCLYLDKPVQTWAEEHCYHELHKFTTSAAPIHDIEGKLIGCIGITGFASYVSLHTLGMAKATSYAIENKIKISQSKGNSIIENYTSIIKKSISDGLIILDHNKNIVSINRRMESILQVKEEYVLGRNIDNVLVVSVDLNSLLDKEEDIFNKKTIVHLKNKEINCNISISKFKDDMGGRSFVIIINKEDSKVNFPSDNYRNSRNNSKFYSFKDIIGDSEAIKESIELAKIASQGSSNVLIMGESGTGKELFAQSIHNNSSRRNKPFIDVNCGALPISLGESELFGYEGGSYTGAKKEGQPGKFELANGGTLFLDEIGELPLSLQASLLRVIQERKVTRIGGTTSKEIDIMIIAATNRNLFEAVQNNTFRGDLFYRLNVFNINIPPLRARKEDISKTISNFIEKYNEVFNTNIEGIAESALNILFNYNWPGNVREMENIIERAVQIAKNKNIESRDLPVYIQLSVDPKVADKTANISIIEAKERETIINILKKTKGNAKVAAEILGISRATMYRKLSKLDININNFRKL